MEKGDGLRQREAPGVEQEMAAAQRPQLRLRPDLAAQPIAPGAGGVDDAAGLDLEGFAADAVAKVRSLDAVRPAQQRFRRQIIERQGAVAPRLGEHPQDETRVVGLGVEIGPTALQPAWRQNRRKLDQRGRVMPAPGARPGEEVIGGESETEHPAAVFVARAHRQQKTQRPHQAGRGLHELGAVAHGFAGEPDRALRKIAQPAMNQLRRPRRGAAREVTRIDKRGVHSGARAFQGDARAGNAPAHDQHVERRPFAQSRETLFPAQNARSAGRLPAPSGSKCSIIAAGVRMPR